MLSIVLVCLGLMSDGAGAAPPADVAAYRAAAAAAGKDPSANIRLALWCEAHGMTAERMKHLAAAVVQDPGNALARGLMGMVARDGGWERPEDAVRRAKTDEAMMARLSEYNARRDRLTPSAESHWKLALWCEQAGLKAEARAHLATVTQLDPGREAAWRRLGFRKAGGRWVTEERLAADRVEAAAQKQADAHWKPLLTRWRGWLRGKDRARREEAESALTAVTDPRAVPAVWSVFGVGDGSLQEKAVQVLGQIDAPGASRALAMLAVHGRSAPVRQAAAQILRQRDPRDYLGLLIALVRDRLKYEIRPGQQPNEPAELVVEGERYNVLRGYFIDAPTFGFLQRSIPPRLFDSSVPFDPYSSQNAWLAMQGLAMATAPWALPMSAGSSAHPGHRGGAGAPSAAANAQIFAVEGQAALRDVQIAQQLTAIRQVVDLSRQQLAADIQEVEAYNADVGQVNDRVVPILNYLTGQDLGPSQEAWRAWWTDQLGYSYTPPPDSSQKPTYTQFVENPFVMPHACFAAGTTVQTLEGPRPIESIRIGDQVLSQDARTGRIAFTPVMTVYHNKPAPTFRVALAGRSIVATGIHRLWKAGKGWVMVRELKAGDLLRTLGGVARVEAVEPDRVQPVFNLRVAEGESYFVGDTGVLAHDNSTINPVDRPFDAVAAPAAARAAVPVMPSPNGSRSMLGR